MITRRWIGLTTVIVASVLLWPASAPIGAQTAADLFNPNVLQEIRIFINSKDLALLRERYALNTFYPADLVWVNGNNLRVRNVGVRSRGTGSRNPVKMGLQVDIDRYTKDQRFLGLEGFVLDNLWQDSSLIREMLAMSVFRRMGQAAPREAFCRLFINNEYQGLYANADALDATFLNRTFGNGDRYLFEYKYQFPLYGQYPGDDLAIYKLLFEPRTHELDPDALLYGPIRDLFREINGPDDAVWRERVEARIDLTEFMTQVAIEAFLAENDALLGYAGMNNFYLFRDVGSTKNRLIPWDRDFSFTFLDSSIFRSVDENVIVRRALAQPDLRTLFLDVLENTARSASEQDWLAGEIDRIEPLIAAAVFADTKKQFSSEQWIEQLAFLREFARVRPPFVIAQVAQSR